MIRRILYAALAIVLVFVGLSSYVALRVGPDIGAIQTALRSADKASKEDIDEAQKRLRSALDGLESVPARVLRAVPVIRQNLDAAHATIESAGPALEAASDLRGAIDELEDRDLVSNGTVDLDALDRLVAPLNRARESLSRLEQILARHRTGWLLPPVWERIDELLRRTADLRTTIEKARNVVSVVGPMLGEDGRRDYVVLLMNNAELRGAGGIVTGVGRLTVNHGRLRLGRFAYYQDVGPPEGQRTVPAPPDFERRFARVGANTTIWVNTTYCRTSRTLLWLRLVFTRRPPVTMLTG